MVIFPVNNSKFKIFPIFKNSVRAHPRFQPQDLVFHRVFGKGKVLEVFRVSPQDKIRVKFESGEIKLILASYLRKMTQGELRLLEKFSHPLLKSRKIQTEEKRKIQPPPIEVQKITIETPAEKKQKIIRLLGVDKINAHRIRLQAKEEERGKIKSAMEENEGNATKTAAELHMPPSTLRWKIQAYKLERALSQTRAKAEKREEQRKEMERQRIIKILKQSHGNVTGAGRIFWGHLRTLWRRIQALKINLKEIRVKNQRGEIFHEI